MKNRRDIGDYITQLESKYPVDGWSIDGIDLWPIIRIKIFFILFPIVEGTFNESKKDAKPKPLDDKFHLLPSRIRNSTKYKKFESQLKLNRLTKSDYLFGVSVTQRATFDEVSYNKFADPILELGYNGQIIEMSFKHLYPDNLHKPNRVHYFYDYLNAVIKSKNRRLRLSMEKDIKLARYDQFISEIAQNEILKGHIGELEVAKLCNLVDRFMDFSEVYEAILNKVKPKMVFTVCYYSFGCMALNFAARKKNIKTVEIQHGPQSDVHMAYASWTNVPSLGYNTLPDIFWNWDSNSFDVINEWLRNQSYHKAFIGGNPWVDYLIDSSEVKEKKIILYSLQNLTLDHSFPEFIINEIKTSEKNIWWLRMHPRHVDNVEEFKEFLAAKGILDLVNIEEATALPLPRLLVNTKVHITCFSGCTLEAAQLNVPTILIDERGKDAFPKLMNEGIARYADQNNFSLSLKELIANEKSERTGLNTVKLKDVMVNKIEVL